VKITKRQLRRIIREAEGSTKEYDDDSALVGGQSKLKDVLQKAIIDKTVEEREERDEEDREESNESFKITKRQLRRMIREEKAGLLKEMHPQKGINFDINKDVAIEEDGMGSNHVITRDDFYDMISDYSKELTGRRFRDFEKLNKMNIQQVAEFYEDMFDSVDAIDVKSQIEKEARSDSDGRIGFEDETHPMENSPRRQGMGHRTEGIMIKTTQKKLRKFIRESILKETFDVPIRLTALASQMKKIAMSAEFPEVAKSVEAFNSGYFGVVYTGPDNVKMMLLDQPGVVGPDDQSGGYVWFGDPKIAKGSYDASTSVQGVKSFAGNSGQGSYGDVDITEATRREVYNEFLADFMGILNDFK